MRLSLEVLAVEAMVEAVRQVHCQAHQQHTLEEAVAVGKAVSLEVTAARAVADAGVTILATLLIRAGQTPAEAAEAVVTSEELVVAQQTAALAS